MHPLTIMLTELRQGIIPPNKKPRRNLTPRPLTPPRQPHEGTPLGTPTKKRVAPSRLEMKTKETKKKLDALQRKADEFRKQLSLHTIDAHSEIN